MDRNNLIKKVLSNLNKVKQVEIIKNNFKSPIHEINKILDFMSKEYDLSDISEKDLCELYGKTLRSGIRSGDKKVLTKSQQYIKQGDLCQDSEEALHCYENALRCSDITSKEKMEVNKKIRDIKSRRWDFRRF